MPDPHRLEPGSEFKLSEITTRGKELHDSRAVAEAEFREVRQRLIDLQPRLYAEGQHKLLIVFQAMDAGGKDSHIRRVLKGVNPQGVRVTSFKVPSHDELAHDFLWRIHKAVPAKGMIAVFNRSHYEDVLVVRVHNIVPEEVWRPRFDLINDFERMLVQTGTRILKFYLHISKEEQRDRFQDRVDRPEKHWKFSFEDLEKRKLWDAYMVAFEEMLQRTTTTYAPWYVIPADQKWYSTLAVTRAIVAELEALNPQYPPAEGDLSGVVIE